MSDIVKFDDSATPNRILEYLKSVNTPDYASQPNVLVNPDLSAVISVPLKYWKHVAGAVVEMTQTEKNNLDAAEVAAIIANAKVNAKSLQDAVDELGRLMRAIAKLTVDEINVLRTRDRDRAVDVAGAASLAALKTAWAARSALNDRTYTQVKTAIDNIIDGE